MQQVILPMGTDPDDLYNDALCRVTKFFLP
jgi:hypothetical protein